MLKHERGLGSPLPEAGKEHKEESQLSGEEHGPDSGLSEHVDGCATREEDGGGAEDGEKEKYEPGAKKIGPERVKRWAERVPDATIRTA